MFTSSDKREKAHEIFYQTLLQAGVSDYVIIDLDAPKNKPHLYPYAINAAFQKHSIEELLHFISLLNGEHHLDMVKDDFEDNDEYLDYLEQVFIVALEMENYTDSINLSHYNSLA